MLSFSKDAEITNMTIFKQLSNLLQCCGPSRSFDMKVEDEKDDEKKVKASDDME